MDLKVCIMLSSMEWKISTITYYSHLAGAGHLYSSVASSLATACVTVVSVAFVAIVARTVVASANLHNRRIL
jgi:hypothetical protein